MMAGGGNDTLDYDELLGYERGAVMQGRTLSCLGMGEMKGPTKAAPNGRRHPGFDTVLLGTERPVIGVKQSWRS
jgi:hypothetical protein